MLLHVHLKQLLENLPVLVIYDGGHFKLPLQGLYLLLEGFREPGHFHPFLHLLKELDQTKADLEIITRSIYTPSLSPEGGSLSS